MLGIIFLPLQAWSQTLKIKDAISRQGIAEVVVYASDNQLYRQTNHQGELSLDPFINEDTLFFQHPAYQEVKLSLSEIQQMKYRVYMEEKVIQMPEAVIMVNRWEQNKEEIPHQIVSVKPSDIAFQNPQTAADILDKTGQVFVQKSQLGGGSPMIRGFSANSVLIVVDGVRMNNAIFRSGNLQNIINIDPSIIGEAEVVFGPGSVIYGSDALGGVMDFHTRLAQYSTSDKLEIEGSAMARYASANQEKTGHFDISLKGRRFSALTSLTYSDFDDLRAGSKHTDEFPDFGKRYNYAVRTRGEDSLASNPDVNMQVPSGYRQINLMQKLQYRLANKTELVYGLLYSTTSDIPRYDRLIVYDENGLPEDAEWYYGPQEWMMHSLKAKFYQKNKMFDEAKLTVAYQYFEESRNDRGYQSANLRTRTEQVNAYTINFDADKVFNPKHQMFYGAEMVYNTVASEGTRKNLNTEEVEPTSTRYPDGGSEYTTAALYLNHKWNFDPHFTLNTGLRYSRVWLESRFTENSLYDFPYDQISLNTGALSGSAGLVYRPDASWQLNFLLSSGFRSPNVDDAGKVFDSEPGNVVVPNPDLGPEYSYNGEIGVSKRIGEKLRAEGVVFYSWLRDAMVRRNYSFNGMDSILYDGELSRVQAIANAGKAYVFGFSLNAEYTILPELALQSTLTYTSGRDLEQDAALRHAAPLFGSTRLSYREGKFRGEFSVRYNGAIAYEDLAPSEQNKPYLYTEDGALAWYTLNLIGNYQFNEYLQFSGGMENILDRHYWPYSSGIAAPGRNLIVSLRAHF
ncbi:TonB-dependent receptor plug domain-containing protein [Catalinimonas niigatensis]|uniref:TonB-dependent receptor plug domain-containing protein n=1 Tax=Catalinimonas niigatensis TaxID=1397264 RepID=UPI0026665C7E|nr:TonB-dependent receptor [Catalinimonas niigatensis]WPP49522.1 TonB-dependent receptor [Catalinimonas niigatensis]